mgnify:CR=1 FL=1
MGSCELLRTRTRARASHQADRRQQPVVATTSSPTKPEPPVTKARRIVDMAFRNVLQNNHGRRKNGSEREEESIGACAVHCKSRPNQSTPRQCTTQFAYKHAYLCRRLKQVGANDNFCSLSCSSACPGTQLGASSTHQTLCLIDIHAVPNAELTFNRD